MDRHVRPRGALPLAPGPSAQGADQPRAPHARRAPGRSRGLPAHAPAASARSRTCVPVAGSPRRDLSSRRSPAAGTTRSRTSAWTLGPRSEHRRVAPPGDPRRLDRRARPRQALEDEWLPNSNVQLEHVTWYYLEPSTMKRELEEALTRMPIRVLDEEWRDVLRSGTATCSSTSPPPRRRHDPLPRLLLARLRSPTPHSPTPHSPPARPARDPCAHALRARTSRSASRPGRLEDAALAKRKVARLRGADREMGARARAAWSTRGRAPLLMTGSRRRRG